MELCVVVLVQINRTGAPAAEVLSGSSSEACWEMVLVFLNAFIQNPRQ